jgi:dihydropteroate synthase
MHWTTTRFTVDLLRPRVMGIVNVTPDSFSDGGRYAVAESALAHCERLLREGADILDIGGESTRPGARMPDVAEELRRVMPVLRGAVQLGAPVSVDTSRPEVIRAALDLGVDIVNDVRALRWPGALEAVAGHTRCGVCLMHTSAEPEIMQDAPHYNDVVAEVAHFLALRAQVVRGAGIDDARIVLDPGYGFGKSHEHNLSLLAGQDRLLDLGRPLLIGWSRKGTLGHLTGRVASERLAASVAAALAGVQRGARIVRVHDVAATVDALAVWRAAGLGPVSTT